MSELWHKIKIAYTLRMKEGKKWQDQNSMISVGRKSLN